MPEVMIPVQNGSRIVGKLPLSVVELTANYYRVVRNKRNHIQRVIVRERQSLVPLSNNGEHFRQPLSCGGSVHALRGVPGSEARA